MLQAHTYTSAHTTHTYLYKEFIGKHMDSSNRGRLGRNVIRVFQTVPYIQFYYESFCLYSCSCGECAVCVCIDIVLFVAQLRISGMIPKICFDNDR